LLDEWLGAELPRDGENDPLYERDGGAYVCDGPLYEREGCVYPRLL